MVDVLQLLSVEHCMQLTRRKTSTIPIRMYLTQARKTESNAFIIYETVFEIKNAIFLDLAPYGSCLVLIRHSQCHIPEDGIFIVTAVKTSNPTRLRNFPNLTRMVS
jgi:hypothetical protein